ISDGRRNAGGSVEEAGAYLKRRKVKEVMVVGVGDPAEAWITTLREVHAAERVFKGDPLKVSAIVSAEGYGAQTLVVVLDEVDEKGVKIRDLHRVQIEVGGDTASASVDFPPVLLAKEGDRFLRIEVEPPFGETKEDRHARTHKVEVLSQKLRLLVVAGSPSHEFRVLRNQMIRDKTIDVSCWLQSADSDFPQDGNSTIKELPKTPKELDVFDVVVMVDADPVLLDRALPPMLRDAITMRGLGLWFVMGEKFSVQAARPGSSMTPLIELLPVEIDLSLAENLIGIGRYFKREFHWELTREGKGHRVTGILTDPTINATLWSKLPGYRFAIPVLRAKPAATVLVRHADKTKRSQDGSWPLIALQFVGAGRVLWSGTDEVNRWRSVAPEAYNRLWVKGLRWLYEGKLAGGSSRYRLGASTEKLTLGQEVDVFLRALDQNFEAMVAPTTKVRLFGPGGQTEDLALAKSEVGDGRYQGAFRPRTTGPWTVQALSEETGEAVGRPVLFAVVPSELESQGPMGLAELTRLAEAAGGSMVSPIDLAQRAQEVRSATTEETFTLPFPLWDKWPTLLLIVLLLSVEWILRKRFDLL
ncbi:MAG: hypothetical protein QGG14_08690, partial [Planctomycetota bacterium]|nr:hypothetical protein [Planctomycetota bacterium]